ncbi:MAG: xylose isomerase [Gammaproteobacteria bacterium]|nr:xylose isomerase [Gammaproteobacteria bacterium]|tara:strand:+ start:2773 stop:3615 length:843 start_codon:yes stop_codon:yes gene_type:complete
MLTQAHSRRRFLRNSLLCSGAFTAPLSIVAAQSQRIDRIGLQLYTLRNEMAQDFEGTLEKVAELGFKEMQFAGYHGNSPTEVRRILDRLGLSSPAAHVGLNLLRDDIDRQIDIAGEIGQQYIVVPSLPANERTLADYERHAEALNEFGQRAKNAGLSVGYHNHNWEFELQGEKIGYDYLLYFTDSDLVMFELDLFWAVDAGADPIEIFKKNPGRFPMVHVKDRNASGNMVDVGRGVIDFAEIFTHSDTAGIEHYFIEHDFPEDGINSVAYSFNTVDEIRF